MAECFKYIIKIIIIIIIYIYMHTYIHIHTHIHTHILYIHLYIHTYIHTYIHLYIHPSGLIFQKVTDSFRHGVVSTGTPPPKLSSLKLLQNSYMFENPEYFPHFGKHTFESVASLCGY